MYDLGDAVQWEFFFPNVDKPLLVVPGDEPKLDEPEDEENLEVCKLMKNVTLDYDDLYQIGKFPKRNTIVVLACIVTSILNNKAIHYTFIYLTLPYNTFITLHHLHCLTLLGRA